MRVRAALVLLVFALGSLASHARAEAPRPVRYDLRVDLPLTAAGLLITALPLVLGGPRRCRLCGSNALDDGARRGLVWERTHAAYNASNALAFAVPAAAAGLLGGQALATGDAKSFGVDALIVTEAVSLALALNQVVKLAAARERPWVHHQNEHVLAEHPRRSEDNVSFYSAHTTFAFSTVFATGTLASLRGYRSAPYVWGIGLPLAALTGYLRIAADRHYLTDVLTGALVSSAVGAALPLLLHGRKAESAPTVALGAGPMLSLSWTH